MRQEGQREIELIPLAPLGVTSKKRKPLQKVFFSSPSWSAGEILMQSTLWICTLISVVTTLGIVYVLASEAFHFFENISIFEFFGSLRWSALIEPKEFGIWPLLGGTLLIGVGASVIAVPIGVGAALFLSEYVTGKRRTILKSIVEILAGIPSVVYGFLAISFVTPLLAQIFPSIQFFNALSAAVVVGVMVIPTIASISCDSFEAIRRDLREAAYGLGARKYQVATTVVLPAALSGVVASVMLAFARAIGETMAVTLAAGATPNLTLNPLQSVQTITAFITQVSLGDTPAGSIEYHSMYAVGLVLFVLTLLTNVGAQLIVGRFHEKVI